MKQMTIPQTDLTVSVFCCGTMPLGGILLGEAGDALLDAYVESGGNFFDTAHCYSFWLEQRDGSSERALADYLRRRNLRGSVVVATKGGHPTEPCYRTVDRYLSPGRIAADIDDSLGRMDIETIDLYWLHRDDLRVPVGEIVDCLNAEVEAGRIRYFAGSNWSGERLREANAYAAAKGCSGFVASQPCWSLATRPMVRKMRELTAEDWQFHRASGMPVIPFSPTAQGFFAANGTCGKAYDCPENRERLRVVNRAAAELGATPNQVALAWLLGQPFPVIPILGTTNPDHLRDALGALDVTLSTEIMEELNTLAFGTQCPGKSLN